MARWVLVAAICAMLLAHAVRGNAQVDVDEYEPEEVTTLKIYYDVSELIFV